MKKQAQTLLSLMMMLALLAISCQLLSPTSEPVSSLDERVAQTVAALELNKLGENQPVTTLEPSALMTEQADLSDTDAEIDHNNNTGVVTDTEEPIGPLDVTDTPCLPTVQVSVNTNCRIGPGQDYERVGSLMVGQSAQVIGRNADSSYWIIQIPGRSGYCWLWGRYATVTCATAGLTIYEPPPTPTPRQATATRTPTATRTQTRTWTPTFTSTTTPLGFSCTNNLFLNPDSYVNLETCQALSSEGGQFLYSFAYDLWPIFATRFGIYGSSDPEFQQCANHAGLSSNSIRRDNLPIGTRICFVTGANRVGFIVIESVDSPQQFWIGLTIKTWEISP
jgi:uncharacterized protein YgiM (DUF1202 family)